MKKSSNFFVLLGASFVIYLASDYLFPDTMLYLTGGLFGSTIRNMTGNSSGNLFIWIWGVIVIFLASLLFHLKNRPLKYLTLIVIAILLYVVDFILMEMIKIDIIDTATRNISIAIRVMGKALILALIIYLERKQKLKQETL